MYGHTRGLTLTPGSPDLRGFQWVLWGGWALSPLEDSAEKTCAENVRHCLVGGDRKMCNSVVPGFEDQSRPSRVHKYRANR